jgi:sulfite exporter TauE/SafE
VAKPSNKSVPQVAGELWTLTKDYARQETLDPLKGIGRYLAFGFAGAVLCSIGVVLLMLSLLRALQDHSTLTGNLSWLQYLIVLAAGLLLVALAASRIKKRSTKTTTS